jgi:hypothetical protein
VLLPLPRRARAQSGSSAPASPADKHFVTAAAAQGAKVVQEHLNMIRKIAEMHHVDLNAETARSDSGGL